MAIPPSATRSFDRSSEALTFGARDDRAAAEDSNSGLRDLLGRVSPLDRLLADAGPLGKFRADRNYTLPAGTSALTVRIADAVDHAAATIGRAAERTLCANALGPGRAIDPPSAATPATAEPMHGASAADARRMVDPRPAIATDADMIPGRDAPRNPMPGQT